MSVCERTREETCQNFGWTETPAKGSTWWFFTIERHFCWLIQKTKFWHFYRPQIGRILGRIYPSQILIALRRKCWPWWTNFQIGFPLLSPANSVPVSTIQWNLIRSIWVTGDLNFFEWLIGGFGTRSSTLGAILNELWWSSEFVLNFERPAFARHNRLVTVAHSFRYFKRVTFGHKPFDSSWTALQLWFWVGYDRTNSWVANVTKKWRIVRRGQAAGRIQLAPKDVDF